MFIFNILYGLVLCGGESSRMGSDKSLLTYYKKPQREHLYEMLQSFCSEVFISCSSEQSAGMDINLPAITDLQLYRNIGPIGALLTAFSIYPDNDFIVTGCDYPFISGKDLVHFISSLKQNKPASAFYNCENDLYEPILAYYSSECCNLLKEQFRVKNYSLQYFLRSVEAEKYYPSDLNLLKNADTPEAYINAKKVIDNRVLSDRKM